MKYAVSALLLSISGMAFAQNGIVSIPTPNPAIWKTVVTSENNKQKIAFLHKKSGVICETHVDDLKLTGIKDYVLDGTNSACEYQKIDENGRSTLSLYV